MPKRYAKKVDPKGSNTGDSGEVTTQSDDTTPTVFYKPEGIYEITINPCDKYQFRYTKHRTEHFVEVAVRKLRSCLGASCEYSLFLELSEPRNSNPIKGTYPRFHFHGTISIKPDPQCLFSLLEYGLARLSDYGDYQINTYRPDYWPQYYMKQQNVIGKVLKSKGLPLFLTEKTKNPEVVDLKTGELVDGEHCGYFQKRIVQMLNESEEELMNVNDDFTIKM